MKQKNTFAVMFYVRKDAPNKKDEVPIYCRITINGKQSKFALNRSVKLDRWLPKSARHVKGTNEEAQTLNFHIEKVRSKLHQIHSDLQTNGKLITPQIIKEIFQGKTEKQKSLVEILDRYISVIKSRIGNDYKLSTLKKYQSTKKHVIDCLLSSKGKSDIFLSELNNSFIYDLENYLKVERKCGHNSAMKYIKLFKTFIKYAVDNDLLNSNPFKSFKTTYQEVKREALSFEELRKIESIDFLNDSLNQIRDVFVFCCYTGLAYVDVNKLSKANLVKNLDGKMQISVSRTKTDSVCNIQLFDNAVAILERYENHPECLLREKLLPVLTNQKYNCNLP